MKNIKNFNTYCEVLKENNDGFLDIDMYVEEAYNYGLDNQEFEAAAKEFFSDCPEAVEIGKKDYFMYGMLNTTRRNLKCVEELLKQHKDLMTVQDSGWKVLNFDVSYSLQQTPDEDEPTLKVVSCGFGSHSNTLYLHGENRDWES